MKYYRVLLQGENFLIRQKSKKQMMGFYTNRFVESDNPEQAELKAVSLIKVDKKLIQLVKNKSWQKQPMIYMEEIYELNQSDMENQQGYIWYLMDQKFH
jgi:hypothetical protein